MNDTRQHLITLCHMMAAHTHRSPATISRLSAGSGEAISRLQRGRDITIRRAAQLMQWFSDNWPSDLEWPPDIPRPDPAPLPESVTRALKHRNGSRNGSSKPAPEPTPSDPLAAVNAAREREHEAMLARDSTARLEAQQAAREAGSTLGPDGMLASPGALCLALGVKRYVYDRVVGFYADGKPGERKDPRALRPVEKGKERKSETQRALEALEASGDKRFARRAARKAAGAALRGAAF